MVLTLTLQHLEMKPIYLTLVNLVGINGYIPGAIGQVPSHEGMPWTMSGIRQECGMNGQVVPQRSCRHLTPSELAPSNKTEVKKQAEFDAEIKCKLGDSFTLPPP